MIRESGKLLSRGGVSVFIAATMVFLVTAKSYGECLGSGIYNSLPIPSVNCAFGSEAWSVSSWSVSHSGGTTISVIASPGPLPVLVGTRNCGTSEFTASATIPGGSGGCTVVYSLVGTVLSQNVWSGTLTASYVGTCFGCMTEVWSLTGQLASAVGASEQGHETWGRVKAQYRHVQ